MKNVSAAYLEHVDTARVIYSRIAGELKTDTAAYAITDANVIPGTLSISTKCVNKSNFEYGAVIVGQMNISLLMPDIDRYSLFGATITLTYYITLSDGTEEAVPLGTWTVSEPEKTKRIIALTCYDNMLALDEEVTEEVYGTPFNLLAFSCDKCGIELANTEEEITAMPNGTSLFTLRVDRIDTYRDFVSYIAMVLCCFATIDENGRLLLKQFSKVPDRTITAKNVLSSTISDYQTVFAGVYARFIADVNYAPYYIIDQEKQGLVLEMGDIPIVQGLPEFKHDLLQNIKDDLDAIIYTPLKIGAVSDPCIEIGDMIALTNNGDEIRALVTSVTWIYHGKQTMQSAGSNPRLANVKDSTRKLIASLESEVTAKDVATYVYTNVAEYTIKDNLTEIILFNYSTIATAKPIFIATVQLEMLLDGNAEFHYFIDGIEIETATLEKYLAKGKHFLTFCLYLEDNGNVRHTLTVQAKAVYVASDARKQAADIGTAINFINAVTAAGDITAAYKEVTADTTQPTMKILKQDIKAVLFAQGLAGAGQWDGTLSFMEDVGITFGSLKMANVTDTPLVETHEPQGNVFADAVSLVFGGLTLAGISENLTASTLLEIYTFSTLYKDAYTYNSRFVSAENAFAMRTKWEAAAEEQPIDIGRLQAVSVDLSSINVESVVIE